MDIHFPHPSTTDSLPPALSEKPTHELAHALKSKPTATELWSSVRRSLKGPTLRHAEDVRTAEQRIVHWTDDREAHICVICGLPFSITVRKHHCRLCGRVVCYVPPNSHPAPISKDARCSTHFIYDWLDANDRGKGGVVTELQDPSSLTEEQEAAQAASCPSTVRSCRECLDSLLRDQSAKFPAPVPTWLKLHRVLLQTQDDIERTLPALQEQLLNPGNSPAALLATRKKILALLANYDALARRIRDLPLAEGQSAGGSQERLQRAIATRASTYLSEQMGLLKGLGSFEDLHSDATSSASSSVSRNDPPSPSTSARRTKHINENDRTDISKGARELQERADKLAVLVE